LLGYVEKYINPRDVVLDIGGNVGEFALAAAHRAGPDGAVLTVEPDPFLANLILRTSMEPANQDIKLNVLSVACSSEASIERFYICARGRASNALTACGMEDMGGARGELLVPTTTIDAIVASWSIPSFVKIDVEGAECAVLEGATRTLAIHRPLVLIEVRIDKDKVREIFWAHKYVLFDPAAGLAGTPVTQCLFDTLAVPEERVPSTGKVGFRASSENANVRAVEEERFRRAGFPTEPIRYCLRQAGVRLTDIDHVAINSDPKAQLFERYFFALPRCAPRPRPAK
jgi:FkbM family methyltransferase